MLIKPEINMSLKEELMEENTASIWLELKRTGQKKVHIGGIYREHRLLLQDEDTGTDTDQNNFVNSWVLAGNRTNCFLLGDTNLDHLKWARPENGHNTMVDLVKQRIETCGFTQLVQGPTRFWPNSLPSLIDQAWTNSPQHIVSTRNINNAVADHNTIEVVIRLKGKFSTPKEIIKRVRTNFDETTYRNRLKDVDWDKLYEFNDVNLAYNFFENAIIEILDQLAPMTKVQLNKKHKNWLSTETRKLMTLRDSTRNQARTTNSAATWLDYKSLRNRVTLETRRDKRKHFEKIFINCETTNDTKTLYRVTKDQLGWDSGGPPDNFMIEGRKISAPKDMANIQLNTFLNKVEKLRSRLPILKGDPLHFLKKSIQKWGARAATFLTE